MIYMLILSIVGYTVGNIVWCAFSGVHDEYLMNRILLFTTILLLQYYITALLRHYVNMIYRYYQDLLNMTNVVVNKRMLECLCF